MSAYHCAILPREPSGRARLTYHYVDRLEERGVEVVLHTYVGGPHSNAMDEQVAHVRLIMGFFTRHGGVPVP